MDDAGRYAAAIAPVLDRLRLAIMKHSSPHLAEVAQRHSISIDTVTVAAYLRNTFPNRPFARDWLLAVFTYQSADKPNAGLDDMRSRGFIDGDGELLQLIDTAYEFMHDLVLVGDSATAELWADDAEFVQRALPLARRAVDHVGGHGGPVFSILVPSADCAQWLSPAAVLGELVAGLRFHRFDAHVAAWQAAGLTVDEVKQLGPGEQRDAIETGTNERAAAPYRALTADERLDLLSCLAALRG